MLDGDALVGWFVVRRDGFTLISHWGALHHVQSRPDRRGEGVGSALVEEAHRIARDELGSEQLHLPGSRGFQRWHGRAHGPLHDHRAGPPRPLILAGRAETRPWRVDSPLVPPRRRALAVGVEVSDEADL